MKKNAMNVVALVGLGASSLAGVVLAGYLAWHKLRILYEPGYSSACNISQAVNCDRVNTSAWSEVLGLPVSLYAIPLFGLVLWLSGTCLVTLRSDGSDGREGQAALGYIFVAAAAATVVSVLLGGYSWLALKTVCLYCAGLYVVSFLTLALSLVMSGGQVGRIMSAAVSSALRGCPVVLYSIIVVVLLSLGSWVAFTIARQDMSARARAHMAAQLSSFETGPGDVTFHHDVSGPTGMAVAGQPGQAEAGGIVGNAPEPVGAEPAGAAGKAEATGGGAGVAAPTSSSQGASLASAPVGVPGGRLTEEGYEFYVTPLDGQDAFFGNPRAAITVVKYADFECAFCKYFADSIEPVMKKYSDRVRFAMKQFPMNPECNRYMAGYDKHPNACNAAKASICAGAQGKFWEMHDKLYDNAPRLDREANREAARELGLDVAAFDSCVDSTETEVRLQSDIAIARRAGINGTPRAYVQGRLVTGSNSGEALEYYIEKAIESPELFAGAGSARTAPAGSADGTSDVQAGGMVQARTSKGVFHIDAFECAVTKGGKAVSREGVMPAMVSFEEAGLACQAVGKRLCTEEEWITACAGKPAVDDNNNGWYNDDAIEGSMYPYGAFYAPGACYVDAEKGKSFPTSTGAMAQCRTPTGLIDMVGNVSEWVSARDGKPSLMGGNASSGSGGTCNRRTATFGSGYRNQTTGFRCCGDAAVPGEPGAGEELAEADLAQIGTRPPGFSVEDSLGKLVDTNAMQGKVLLVNFFASWCGPCKKEFPVLVELYGQHHEQGLEIVAIGVDTLAKQSVDFAAQFQPPFPIVTDEESTLMGRYGVYSMPATFITDRSGLIRFKGDEFAPDVHIQRLKQAVAELLAN